MEILHTFASQSVNEDITESAKQLLIGLVCEEWGEGPCDLTGLLSLIQLYVII